DKPNLKKQEKLANLGEMVEKLEEMVPNILNEAIDSKLLSKNIILRILPISYPNLPILPGHLSYLTTCKTINLIVKNFVLNNRKVKLHISSIKIIESNFNGIRVYGLFPWTSKIIIKWRTCSDNCEHLKYNGEEARDKDEKNGGKEKMDLNLLIDKLFKKNSSLIVLLKKYLQKSLLRSIDKSNLAHKMMHRESKENSESDKLNETHHSGNSNGTKNETENKIISGVFIFELNLNNNKVLVHTVDKVEMIDKSDFVDVDSEL
ncbi:Mco32p ASCRUDRAFT_26882, partial [Ascoidea rubescens DSM 1968]